MTKIEERLVPNEVRPRGPELLGSVGNRKGSQALMALRLAQKHQVSVDRVSHCLDGVPHPQFGKNLRFKIVNESGKLDQPLLVQVRQDGSQEVLAVKYLGSARHLTLSKPNRPRFVHFYITAKRKKQ